MAPLQLPKFEQLLARYTAKESRELLGAIALVVDDEGTILYHHADGYQSLDEDSPALDKTAVFELGSAGKLFIHIAAIQCVERGLIGLDEPLVNHMPELEGLQVVSKVSRDGQQSLILTKPATAMTLRHLLTHTSGLADSGTAILQEWQDQNVKGDSDNGTLLSPLDGPLIFNPGEGWSYGPSIGLTAKVIAKLTNQNLSTYVQANIFEPLGMTSSTFLPLDKSSEQQDLEARRLQMVVRQPDSGSGKTQLLFARRAPPMAPATNCIDYGRLLAALMSPKPRVSILKPESIDLLFAGALSDKSLQDMRLDTETYAAPTGLPIDIKDPQVNFTAAGALLVQKEAKLSGIPVGTLTWNGMPNVAWTINRECKRAAVFATQLLPVDDPLAVEAMMAFFREVWIDGSALNVDILPGAS